MTGLPSELIGKANLAVTAANPQRIYALVEALPGGGLYRSDNGGQSWAMMNSPTFNQPTEPFRWANMLLESWRVCSSRFLDAFKMSLSWLEITSNFWNISALFSNSAT